MFSAWLSSKVPSRSSSPCFLALGDSIISDCYPGPNRGAASLVFSNVDNEFPEFRGLDLSTLAGVDRAHFFNRSRSGYRLSEVESSLASLPAALEVGWLLLSVGGNDFLTGGLPEFQGRFREFLERLRKQFSGARVAILNAYDPTDGTGLVQSALERGQDPRPEIVEGLRQLNSTIAAQAGECLVDVHRHFLGHGVERGQRPLWFQRDIEPNLKGASEIRRLINQKFADYEK